MVRRRRFATACCLLLIAIAAPVNAANDADNMVPAGDPDLTSCRQDTFYTGGSVCQTDDSTLYWFPWNSGGLALESANVQAVMAAMNQEYEPTQLTINRGATVVTEGAGETDVVFEEGDALGNVGIHWCDDKIDGTTWRCDQSYIRIIGSQYFKRVVCHEAGHAVGLTHGNNARWPGGNPVSDSNDVLGCLQRPLSQVPPDLGANQVARINEIY